MRRLIGAATVAAAAVVLTAIPAAAHTEWQPDTAAPGSIIALTLFSENEQPGAGFVTIDLQFPQPLTIVELGPVEGWTATPVGGSVGPGTTATGVSWTGGPATGDLSLPITLGPLPDQEGRLQFKVVQTYDNGEVVRWIDDNPAGGPEPEHPGPVLDVVAGGPGTTPATTAAPTTSDQVVPFTTAGDEDTATVTIETEEAQSDDSGSALPWVIGGLLVAALVAGGVVLYLRSRNKPPSGPGGPGDAPPPTPPASGEPPPTGEAA